MEQIQKAVASIMSAQREDKSAQSPAPAPESAATIGDHCCETKDAYEDAPSYEDDEWLEKSPCCKDAVAKCKSKAAAAKEGTSKLADEVAPSQTSESGGGDNGDGDSGDGGCGGSSHGRCV